MNSREEFGASRELEIELIGNAFYRGRGAYLVGRIIRDEVKRHCRSLFVFVMRRRRHHTRCRSSRRRRSGDSVFLHPLLFPGRCGPAYELVRYLRLLHAAQTLNDLYNAIGHPRHGKTEFYRDFVAPSEKFDRRFVIAEGTPGMVMLVFTLPSYDVVFKLIKDRFDFPKDTTRADVMRRYRWSSNTIARGRLVEAHEFEHLRIAQERFDLRCWMNCVRRRRNGATRRQRCHYRARICRAPHASAEFVLQAKSTPMRRVARPARLWPIDQGPGGLKYFSGRHSDDIAEHDVSARASRTSRQCRPFMAPCGADRHEGRRPHDAMRRGQSTGAGRALAVGRGEVEVVGKAHASAYRVTGMANSTALMLDFTIRKAIDGEPNLPHKVAPMFTTTKRTTKTTTAFGAQGDVRA